MGDRLGIPGAVDFLANPQLPSVASMANPLDGPGRGSSLGSETQPEFIDLLGEPGYVWEIGAIEI